jgi:uncharacterized protein YcnI
MREGSAGQVSVTSKQQQESLHLHHVKQERISMSRRMNKLTALFASFTACMLAFVSVASAHVTVWPKTSTVGAWEKYTMRVPTEKDIPTVKIVLKIPNGVTFEQYEAVPGWFVTEQKDSSGRVTSVTWTATSGGIAPGQFQEFSFVAQNPKMPEKVAWDAYQYYKDNSIVEWTGDEGSQTPHSITDIMTASTTAAPTTTPTTTQSNTVTSTSTNTSTSTTPVWPTVLSVIAAVLSVGSLVVALRAKRS